MPAFSIDLTQVRIFLSILLRLGLCLFLLPVFKARQIPGSVKAWSTVALTVMVYPAVKRFVAPFPLDPLPACGVVLSELIYASIFALSLNVLFGAFHMAGQLVSFQMGLGFAQVADPQTGTQNVLLSQFLQILATLFLFATNAHLLIIRIFVESFRHVPVGGFFVNAGTVQNVVVLFGRLFVIALKIAAPIMSVQLLLQVGFALIAKFSPQVNILIVTFPITIGVGILFATFSLSGWSDSIGIHLNELLRFFRAVGL